MDLSLFSRSKRIVNMVINDYSIRYVEVKNTEPHIPLKWGERILPKGIIVNGTIEEEETLISILEECVSDWKIGKRFVRFIVPDSFVSMRKETIPIEIEDDEVDGYIFSELGTKIHLPFDDPVFQAVVLNENEEKKEKQVLIFAAPEEKVTQYADLLSEVKLEPIVADISFLSLYRIYHFLGLAEKGEHLLMIQFDVHRMNISIFEDDIPLINYHMYIEMLDKDWEKKLNSEGQFELSFIGNEEEFLFQLADTFKEISRLMDFYRYSLNQGKKSVTKIFISGDHPLLTSIKKEMHQRFDLPVVMINSEHIKTGQDKLLPSSYHLALGLALKEV